MSSNFRIDTHTLTTHTLKGKENCCCEKWKNKYDLAPLHFINGLVAGIKF